MKITRTVTWTTRTGRNIEITIERTREVRDNIVNADGDKVNLGKETIDLLSIEVKADGKFVTSTKCGLDVVTEEWCRNYKELKDKGVYARLGDACINEEQYNTLITAIAEIEAELTETPEYKEVKVVEEAKEAKKNAVLKREAAEYAHLIKSGLCTKCHSWCYGDCEASAR